MTRSSPVAQFFCKTDDPSVLGRVDFYAQDLRILGELGFDVRIATHPRQLRAADLYFVWWWTWAFAPVAYARMRRRPVVVTGVMDLQIFHQRSAPHRALHRYALRRADANVFVSRLEYEGVRARFRVANAAYCPLVIDTAVFSPDAVAREPFVLTIAGSGMDNGNSQRKCIEEVIRSVPAVRARHPGVRFVIVGKQGSDFPHLQAVAREIGADEHIEFTGIVSEARKVELLQRCSVYLQPTRFEGFGLSILEAMACGAPVVTSAEGAVPELCGKAAVYVDGADPAAISDGVAALLDDPATRASLGAAARARAEAQFAYERRKAGLREIIDRVL